MELKAIYEQYLGTVSLQIRIELNGHATNFNKAERQTDLDTIYRISLKLLKRFMTLKQGRTCNITLSMTESLVIVKYQRLFEAIERNDDYTFALMGNICTQLHSQYINLPNTGETLLLTALPENNQLH